MTQSLGRKLFAQGGIYTLSRLLNQASRLVLLPVYALLGKDGVGLIGLMWSVGSFLGFIYAQGLHGAWFRFRFDRNHQDSIRELETTVIWYLVFSGLCGVLILCFLGPFIAPYVTPDVNFYPLGLLTAISAALLVFPGLYERKLQAELRPIPYAIFTGGRTVLTLIVILIFILGFKRGAPGKIEADTFSAVILAGISIYLIRPGGMNSFSKTTLYQCLSYGLPLLPHSLAGLTNEMVDRILINRILGLSATGVYTMGYNLASVSVMVATTLNQAYSPLFIRTVRDFEEASPESRTAAQVKICRAGLQMVTAVGCIALLLAIGSREALMLLPGKDFDESWRVVPPVAAAGVALAAYFVFSQSIVYSTAHIGRLARISIAAALINILANLILLPATGSYLGAAWATLISNTSMMLGALWLGQRSFPVPHEWKKWMLSTFWIGAGLTVLYQLDSHLDSLSLRLACKLAAGMCAGTALLASAGIKASQIGSLGSFQDMKMDKMP